MKKTTLAAAIILTGTLTVGAFAQQNNMPNQGMMGSQQGNMPNQGMMGSQQNNMQNQRNWSGQGMMSGRMGMMSGQMGMHGQKGMGMMGGGMQMFSQLNLTSDQQFKLSILKDEMRIEMKKFMHENHKQNSMGTFLKGNSFDKGAFKEHMNEKHKKMLNLKADNMEKAFKILTKEQISQLKKNLSK